MFILVFHSIISIVLPSNLLIVLPVKIYSWTPLVNVFISVTALFRTSYRIYAWLIFIIFIIFLWWYCHFVYNFPDFISFFVHIFLYSLGIFKTVVCLLSAMSVLLMEPVLPIHCLPLNGHLFYFQLYLVSCYWRVSIWKSNHLCSLCRLALAGGALH